MRKDFQFAVRTLLRTPGFTAVVIATLAIGIGANTAIFSVIDNVLLRPLSFEQPDRIVVVWTDRPGVGARGPLSMADFIDWRASRHPFEKIATSSNNAFTLTGTGSPERIPGAIASADFFATLGVAPLLGRSLNPEEDRPGADSVVVISERFWKNRLGADSNILGRTLTLSGTTRTIIGVMPDSFRYPTMTTELWTNLTVTPPPRRAPYYLQGIARLKPGISVEQARREMSTIAESIRSANPGLGTTYGFTLIPVTEFIVGDVKPPLLVLMAAVALVLLISIANVANLILVRTTGRQRELAIRRSLGASSAQLTRLMLAESLVLAGAGGILGIPFAEVALRLLLVLAPANTPRLYAVAIDGRVLVFTVAASLVSAIAFGFAPVLRAHMRRREIVTEVDRSAGRLNASRSWMLNVLASLEIAMALVLLIGANLLITSFIRLNRVDVGFDPANVLTFQISLPAARYTSSQQVRSFFTQAFDSIRTLPGVQAVGGGTGLPPSDLNITDYVMPQGHAVVPENNLPVAGLVVIDSDYFKALGVPLIRGRLFEPREVVAVSRTVVINESFARQYFPNDDPIGKQLRRGGLDRPNSEWMEVIGVVGDSKMSGLDSATDPTIYIPNFASSSSYVVVRSASDPASQVGGIRDRIAALDRDLALANVRTMTQRLDESVAQPQFRMILLTSFASMALMLAIVGVYGVISYGVSQRVQEIGIRVALGANRRDILANVMGQGFVLTGAGMIIGVLGAFVLTRLMSGLLFGISPTDPRTFVFSGLVLGIVAVIASYLPARRAMHVDPAKALRRL